MDDLSMDVITMPSPENAAVKNGYDETVFAGLSDDDVVSRLARRIGERAKTYYPGLDSRRVRVTGKAWGGRGSARTFKFEIRSGASGEKKTVFAKLYPIYPTFNPALYEYNTLGLLYKSMPAVDETCHVSRPLDFYPELNAYVMESAGTYTFRQYLLENNSVFSCGDSLADLYETVSKCAVWLRTFHHVTKSTKTRAFDFRAYWNSINQDCDYESLGAYGFKGETLAAMDAVIGKLASLDGAYDLACAKSHWDYTPAHVFLDHGRLRVIDILGGDDIPIYEDLGRFLAAMSTVNNLPFHPLFDQRRAETALCDRFLEAYAKDLRHNRKEFLLFTQVYKLKYLIVWFCGQRQQVSAKIHPTAGKLFARLRLARRFERPLQSTVRELSHCLDSLALR